MAFAPVPNPKTGSNTAEMYTYENRTSDLGVIQLREWISGYAQNFTGIHYHYAGRSPRTGFDCSGFTSYILQEFDVKVSAASSAQSKQGAQISLDDILPGDLVFFGGKGRIQHVAMVVECSAEGIICVHSTSSRGVVVENISTSKYWRPKILFARDVITGQKKATSASN
jgi:NlpC/P60 family